MAPSPSTSGQGIAITPVDRLSARRRLGDLEPTPHSPPQSTTYTLRSTQPSATMREDLIPVADDSELSESGLDTPTSYRFSDASSRSSRNCTALMLSYPQNSRSLPPSLSRFMPGHDARIRVIDDIPNPDRIDVQIIPSQKLPSLASNHFRHSLLHLRLCHI